MSAIKKEAVKIINDLPENATWEDVMYKIYVKQKIETSLNDIKEEKLVSHEDVRKRLKIK